MTAEDIFSRCSNDILYPMLTNTNSSGNSGAPSQPAQFRSLTISNILVQHAYMIPLKKNQLYANVETQNESELRRITW